MQAIAYQKLPKQGTSFLMRHPDAVVISNNNQKDNPVLNITKIPIQGHEDLYWVDTQGNIYNSSKIMKTYITREGYECLKLTRNGLRSSPSVHRLVALHFIPNPDNKAEVNHIDGDKSNNCVENLEWVTSSENKIHARDTGLKIYNNPTKGLKIGKGSKYRNVSYDKSRDKWTAAIRDNKVSLGQKRFDIEEDAARHVDYLIDLYDLDRPKNFSY